MEFHGQVIAVCGVDNAFGWGMVDTLLQLGARTVVAIGDPGSGASIGNAAEQTDRAGRGELVCLPDDVLDRPADMAARLGEHGTIDAAINLVPLSPPADDAGGDFVARRTRHVLGAIKGFLRTKQPHGALVNVGWWSPGADGSLAAEAAAAAGSLELLTKLLAKELAPDIRVNAVLAMAVPSAEPKALAERAPEDIAIRLEEAAGPALFLASAAARHMTGSVLLADAGRSLGFTAFSSKNES